MSSLIGIGSFGWIAPEDLLRVPHGRPRDPEAAERCAYFLRTEYQQGLRHRRQSDRKVLKALLVARVRRSIEPRILSTELEQRVADQEARLERQAAAIDYLLTLVPKRARALDSSRLNSLRTEVMHVANGLAGGAVVSVSLEDERGRDTKAAHRFVVSVRGLSRAQGLAVEDGVSDWLFAAVGPDEAPSLSVEVRLDPVDHP